MITATNPRLLPARPDLAAASLRGHVEADRYVEGWRSQVLEAVLDLRRDPRSDAPLDTQLLHGETVQVLEDHEGWAWVQAERDGYVGYVPSQGLTPNVVAASHRVVVARTFVYPAADMKSAVSAALPLAAAVTVQGRIGAFAQLVGGGYVWAEHLAALEDGNAPDPVAIAEALAGTPYLWGGRTPLGLDCSGLVQLSFGMAGIDMPRDAVMQETLGVAVAPGDHHAGLQRGDLVFWPGHVAIMIDATRLVHASGYQMLVCMEPLTTVVRRIASNDKPANIVGIRRRE